MMAGTGKRRIGRALAALAVALLSVAAGWQSALSPASGGMWQVSKDARGSGAQNLCVADPVMLGQWEHRGEVCERTVISDKGSKAIISYTCPHGGFGRSEITLLTPRTMRVATQGIAAGGPFNYVLHARRVGNCPGR